MVLKNTRSPGLCLLVSATRQDLAQGLGVDGTDKAAAVEAGLGTVAAATVGNADEAHGGHDQVGGLFGDALSCFLDEVGSALRHVVAGFAQLRDEAAVDQQLVHIVVTQLGRGRVCSGADEQECDKPSGHGARDYHAKT